MYVIVRRAKVATALKWLTQNNPQYQNINSIQRYSILQTIETEHFHTKESELQSDDREDEMDDSEIVYDSKTETNTFN